MTFTTRDARKAELAHRFGAALLAARRRRKIGKRAIAIQTGISRNALTEYERGRILPQFASACRIADALGDENLVVVARECRTLPCAICAKPFLNDAAANRRYCSEACKDVDRKKRVGVVPRHSSVRLERELALYRPAVAAMCQQCEPSGACRTADCPLRIVSPFPLVLEREPEAAGLPGRWGNGSKLNGAPLPAQRRAS